MTSRVLLRGYHPHRLTSAAPPPSLDPGELTLVRMDGRIDRAMADSLADHPKDLARGMNGGGEGTR